MVSWMIDTLVMWQANLVATPWLHTSVSVTALLLFAWLANLVVKRVLLRGLYKLLDATPLGRDSVVRESRVIARLANVVPALIISGGVSWIVGLPHALVAIVQNVANAFVVLTIAVAIDNTLTIINVLYQRRPEANTKPIKGYVQVAKIAVYIVATVLVIATLVDRSPLILLSGLGAMAAVLMLIFQDTLLSLVASVQISSNDIIRVGDWIEMPQLNADGDVIDIALHTVTVQNFDKTYTIIPTKRFISDPFKNWRGMRESGARRIKRTIFIDQQSLGFLDAAEQQRLQRFNLLRDYLHNKRASIDAWNTELAEHGHEPINTRRLTNIGTLRAYVHNYLRAHPGVHQGMTLMVRQLNPTAEGLPLEIYCFANTIVWTEYEAIQSDIFDHILTIVPEFGLRLFQSPSGSDFRVWQQQA